MKKKYMTFWLSVLFLLATFVSLMPPAGSQKNPAVSGKIVAGYRILPIRPERQETNLTVYRGDYIKFDYDPAMGDPVLVIPALSIERKLTGEIQQAPYIKMKQAGTYAFSLGQVTGKLTVIEYLQANYSAVSAEEASEIISNIQPFVLDVRTPREYKSGHLKDATLIPLQELQDRLKELKAYQNEDILIYCASGNRSTVAAKILIDNGFKRVINLRYGIYEWSKKAYPIVR